MNGVYCRVACGLRWRTRLEKCGTYPPRQLRSAYAQTEGRICCIWCTSKVAWSRAGRVVQIPKSPKGDSPVWRHTVSETAGGGTVMNTHSLRSLLRVAAVCGRRRRSRFYRESVLCGSERGPGPGARAGGGPCGGPWGADVLL